MITKFELPLLVISSYLLAVLEVFSAVLYTKTWNIHLASCPIFRNTRVAV